MHNRLIMRTIDKFLNFSIPALFYLIVIISCKKVENIHCNNSFDPAKWDSCNLTSFVYDSFHINQLGRNDLLKFPSF
jgi:hypothetical protein